MSGDFGAGSSQEPTNDLQDTWGRSGRPFSDSLVPQADAESKFRHVNDSPGQEEFKRWSWLRVRDKKMKATRSIPETEGNKAANFSPSL